MSTDTLVHLYNKLARNQDGINEQSDSKKREQLIKEILNSNNKKKQKKKAQKPKKARKAKKKSASGTIPSPDNTVSSNTTPTEIEAITEQKTANLNECNTESIDSDDSEHSLLDETSTTIDEKIVPIESLSSNESDPDTVDDISDEVPSIAHETTRQEINLQPSINSLADLFQIVTRTVQINKHQLHQQLGHLCDQFNKTSSSVNADYYPFFPPNPESVAVLNLLCAFGRNFYIIGGYPRDHLYQTLRNQLLYSNDIDFLIMNSSLIAIYDYLYHALHHHSAQVILINSVHPHVIIQFNSGMKFDISSINTVNDEFADLKAYLSHSDLTVNALAWHPSGVMIDFFSAKKHISRNKLLPIYPKTIQESLNEDPIRLLRYFKLYGKVGDMQKNNSQSKLNEVIAFIPEFRKRLNGTSPQAWQLKKRFYTAFCQIMLNQDISTTCRAWLQHGLFHLIYGNYPPNEQQIIETAKTVEQLLQRTPGYCLEIIECLFIVGLTHKYLQKEIKINTARAILAHQFNIAFNPEQLKRKLTIIDQLRQRTASKSYKVNINNSTQAAIGMINNQVRFFNQYYQSINPVPEYNSAPNINP